MKQIIVMTLIFLHAIFGVQSVLAQEVTAKENLEMFESIDAQEKSLNNYSETYDAVTMAEKVKEMVGQASLSVPKQVVRSDKRLGFVNFRRIMSSIPQLSGVREALAQEFSIQKNALEQANAELTALEKQVAENKELDYEALAQQLIAKRREVVRQEAAFRDNYSVRRNEEIAKLQKRVLDEIIALAKEQGYDVILNDNGVLYVSEEADLTQLVISRLLDKAIPAGESE